MTVGLLWPRKYGVQTIMWTIMFNVSRPGDVSSASADVQQCGHAAWDEHVAKSISFKAEAAADASPNALKWSVQLLWG